MLKALLRIKEWQTPASPWYGTQLATTIQQSQKMISNVDFDGNGKIKYTEFLVGCLPREQFTDENLKMFFVDLDFR